ncbi:profilin [Toxoplasma gondii TgCatPRC2]|uniref:Profilin n=15 Tax=Toxoplasma gondii TaxID=5811 RepID=B9PJD0_TOXGV|nr:hypothetical protein TGME49_316360 [Toxoplasma gondii ME49]EPR58848.1 hypothetical protein TGGT1_316360 [Toxoplasma gondii GT1]ESS35266.1 profilin [Toxoplasma gondii VEG]KAF4639738.1 hypothetical protein TGRH88_055100 [Toxoplasma gondii]KFG36631.1 profilin [Toxoplasma gondii GAB2-2007-GAL-DOM2]KFG56427.1 profilin [Toxoplasma gondii FOU]KFG66429.1 profilin [Toxoplasma gondii RUB]KFH01962.1 profilin [Toxoplasma gondii VAND]KFH18222.1 profilin [Toxoplasma gondii MAS]KYF40283.1 profilin [To|eukprot:XP_002364803.1 hypothetical protein TGME49_316360 [Toxoplasma gondii ME49]
MAAFSAALAATRSSSPSVGPVSSAAGRDGFCAPYESSTTSSPMLPASIPTNKELLSLLLQQQDWKDAAVFRALDGAILASTFPLTVEETQGIAAIFDSDRFTAVGKGILLQGERYEVFCFHPPLIYGRRGSGANSEGIALVRGVGPDAESLIVMATYSPPMVSACVVPQLTTFFRAYLGLIPPIAVPPLYEKFRKH